MLRRSDAEIIELQCPECRSRFQTTAKKAEQGVVECPNGHRFAVLGMLGGSADEDPSAPR